MLRFRRIVLSLVACLALTGAGVTPALGASHRKTTHHKTKHHKTSHAKKKCSGDRDGDGNEPRVNDGDGCGV